MVLAMSRGRIRRYLLPYLVKHSLLGLVCTSLIVIALLMLKLVVTLTKEMSLMSADQLHPLSTEQVLYYIKHFLLLALFGSLQSFGLYGVIRANRNVLVAYISSLLVACVFTLIDRVLNSAYLITPAFLLLQALFTYLHIHLSHGRHRQISNIHYIPMPNEEFGSQASFSPSKYLQFV